ncbi:hypothetical protein D6D12_08557 [Aureobasidium pullulans]|uniref:GATA-type domain-containing protein n=1 Tax=Aureobasidium pullulans TaxID=5580 RepID=A0AB74JIU2_AURPU|nr:hypothetical protein D6D12_08557 [Aureobasidium pullulans]THX30948.1 hypothetical protein D6D11_09952 [Aureobasidium pullulans]
MKIRLSNWLCAHAWTHRPIDHAEKVQQKCVGCEWVRRGGLKLTWSSICDGSVLCHNCYMRQGDIAQVMPEGYGHVRFMSDLRARKDELDGPGSSAKWDDKKKSELDESARRTHILWQMTESPWFQTLPWKTHRPVRTSLKVERTCPNCTALKSLKLWWQSLTSEESLCNRCYAKPSWPEVMPEGYEDVTTMRGVAKRRKELDIAAPASTNHIPPASLLLLQSTSNRPKSTKPVSPSQTPFSRAFSTSPRSCITKAGYDMLRQDSEGHTTPSTNTSVSSPRSFSTTAVHPRTGKLPSITLMSTRSFSHSSAKDLTKASPKLWEYHRVKGDPEALREYYDRKAERTKKRYDENPDVRERTKIYSRRRWDVTRTNEGFRMAMRIGGWVRTHAWVREHLPWKTHHPLLYDEPVEHYCIGCRYVRRGGLNLWWQAKRDVPETGTDAGSYLCHGCYVPKDNWRAAMPQGYEDVNTYDELKARKKRLGVTGAAEHVAVDDRIRRRVKIRSWCLQPWVRDLPWKTYRPVYFENPAQFECATCDYARIRSAKLWWRKIAENQGAGQSTETHICHNCYTSPDWTEIMPEGYEDMRVYRDLLARDTQIRGPDSAGKHMTNNLRRVRDNIRHWLQRHPWVRQLSWKTYQPLYFKDAALFRCSKCSPARYRSLKMWWRLRDDTRDETLCHSCYIEARRTSLMPEGYEDVEIYKDLVVRKKQVDNQGCKH